jgi:S-methylmethionine-dependent homocysteine/selenocysteine methylase
VTRSFTLLDGGMGKLLQARGAPFKQPEWSAQALIDGHDHVVSAHSEFIDAGADIIITNNYAVVPYHLGEDVFEERAEELVGLSGALARQAADSADHPVRVAGSLPPVFGSYEPNDFDAERAPALLDRIVGALAPHVDLFLAETQSILTEMKASAMACAPYGKPIWLSVTLSDRHVDGRSVLRSGESVTEAASLAAELGAATLLFNCSEPEVMEAAITEARGVLPSSIPVGVYANAFEEKPDDYYAANETVLAHRADLNHGGYTRFVEEWLDAGAEIVGGCCGIMPQHIADIHALRS